MLWYLNSNKWCPCYWKTGVDNSILLISNLAKFLPSEYHFFTVCHLTNGRRVTGKALEFGNFLVRSRKFLFPSIFLHCCPHPVYLINYIVSKDSFNEHICRIIQTHIPVAGHYSAWSCPWLFHPSHFVPPRTMGGKLDFAQRCLCRISWQKLNNHVVGGVDIVI